MCGCGLDTELGAGLGGEGWDVLGAVTAGVCAVCDLNRLVVRCSSSTGWVQTMRLCRRVPACNAAPSGALLLWT